MSQKKRLALFAVCCVALPGAVAACGSNNDSGTATTSGGSSTTSSSTSQSSNTSLPKLNGQNLVFTNYGGESADAAKAAWTGPFSQATGARFALDSPSDPAKVKAMVQSGNITWDLIDFDPATVANNCGTLFDKRASSVDISHVDPKFVTNECGVPIMVQAIALIYNKKLFGNNPPTKITDFMDTSKFPGRRIFLNYPVGSIEPLLMADGVTPDKLYPLDLNRTAAAMKKLGKNLTLESTLAQQSEALTSGNFAMCLCYTARAAVTASKGADIGIVWQHAYQVWDELAAVKGSKSPEAQQAFLNFVAQPLQQANFAKTLPYGPTTPDAKLDLPKSFLEYMPAGHETQIDTPGVYDTKWWGVKANTDKAFAAWTQMTAG